MVVLVHVLLPGFHKSRTHEGVLILQIIIDSIDSICRDSVDTQLC